MQSVSTGDNFHEKSNQLEKTISTCRLLKILPRVLSVKVVRFLSAHDSAKLRKLHIHNTKE